MDQETYLSKRVDDQINWYSKKSTTYKNRYKLLKTIVIFVSVSIPFLSGMIHGEEDWLKIAVGIGGVTIAMIEGVLALFQFQDLWLQYRLTAEMLQREKLIFLTQAGHYHNNSSAFPQFVQRIEGIMSSENQSWVDNLKQEGDES